MAERIAAEGGRSVLGVAEDLLLARAGGDRTGQRGVEIGVRGLDDGGGICESFDASPLDA